MTTDERGRRLRDLAVSVMRSKGTSVAVGCATVSVYRRGALTIRYLPKQGQLEIWYGIKVLVIERREGKPHVARYEPGIWEQELEAEAAEAKRQVPRALQRAG